MSVALPVLPLPSERQVQRSILRMCAVCFKDVLVHHSPNGAHLAGDAGVLLGDGMRKGWPDLIFCWAPGKVAFAEVKRPKRYTVSDDQTAMIGRLSGLGFPVAIVTSDTQAYDFLRQCGAPCSGVLS